ARQREDQRRSRPERHLVRGAIRHMAEASARTEGGMRRIVLSACAAVAAFGMTDAGAQEAVRGEKTAPHLEEGKQAYKVWCAPCHAPNPRLAGTLALQTKYEGRIPAALEDRTDLTPALVEYFVRNGVAWMAPFRPTELTDAQVAAIGAYLSAPLAERGPYAPLLADEMMALREKEKSR